MKCDNIWCGGEMIYDMQSSLYEKEIKYHCSKCSRTMIMGPDGKTIVWSGIGNDTKIS